MAISQSSAARRIFSAIRYSAVQRDTDDPAKIVLHGALLWITGNVHLALRRTVTAQAGFSVILRHHHAIGRAPFGLGHNRIWLATRPIRTEQLGFDDVPLEIVGTRLAVAHQFRWRSDLDLRLAGGVPCERLAD